MFKYLKKILPGKNMSKTNQGAFYNKKFHNVFECKKKLLKT